MIKVKQIKSIDNVEGLDWGSRVRPLGASALDATDVLWLLKEPSEIPVEIPSWRIFYEAFVLGNPHFPRCRDGTLPDFYVRGKDIIREGDGRQCTDVYFFELLN